ncbi:MAG: methyl-accepting chemotaxis protein [Myxococcota bacterium]
MTSLSPPGTSGVRAQPRQATGAAIIAVSFIPIAIALLAASAVSGSLIDEAGAAVGQLAERVTRLFFWSGLAGAVIGAGILWQRLRRAIAPPVSLDAFAERLARGDFAGAMHEARNSGHISRIGEDALARMVERSSQAKNSSRGQRNNLDSLGTSLTTLGESLSLQSNAAGDGARAVEESMGSHRHITEGIDGLSRSAEATSSSILQMVAINTEVTENIHNLALSVQETTTAIEEMTFSVKEVAKNIEELSTAAEETAASMNEMDVSISQVETNANETSKLSETVTSDAETGVSAINKTINGIDKIKESSRVAAEVIGNLGQKIDEIGNILTVIDDVAEQTNLLALNAAIIAAQAGEHGRGFAVVADEIKALAERTGSSTKEIAELIKAVQDESRNAIQVMSQGVEDVEEGVRLGHNAEDALRKIVESAKRSTLMIKAIAQATVEQSKGSKQVTNAISRIAETVQQIALATAEQAKGSEQIMKSAERMKVITQQVERSTEEQNRGGRQMTEAIENIRDMVEQITQALQALYRGNDRASAASTQVKTATERSVEVCRSLERLVGDSMRQLEQLEQSLPS